MKIQAWRLWPSGGRGRNSEKAKPAATREGRLDGWKEIASFLRRCERSVQRWEREKGLPVHRIDNESGKGSSVYAFEQELSDWLKKTERQGFFPTLAKRLRQEPLPLYVGLGSLILVAGIVLAGVLLEDPPTPAWATVQVSRVFVYDRRSELLWEKSFDIFPDPNVLIHDLEGDGQTEVLLTLPNTETLSPRSGSVLCLEADGRLRWTRELGRTVSWDGEVYPQAYKAKVASVGRSSGSAGYVVVSSNHIEAFPAQTLVLDARGNQIGEYWHTGHISAQTVVDIDGDGTDEILVGGINEILHAPVLSVISHRTDAAISPVPEGFDPQLSAGKEICYGTLPMTDVGEMLKSVSRVADIDLLRDGALLIHVEILAQAPSREIRERMYVVESHSLSTRNLSFTDPFLRLHEDLFRRGVLDHPFSDAERSRFEKFSLPCRVSLAQTF